MDRALPAINIQHPWADLIVSGKKTVETRTYPIPAKYVGTPLFVIRTAGGDRSVLRQIVGIVQFGTSFQYASEMDFNADKAKHLVAQNDSKFSWKIRARTGVWGWPVLRVEQFNVEIPLGLRTGFRFTRRVAIVNRMNNLR